MIVEKCRSLRRMGHMDDVPDEVEFYIRCKKDKHEGRHHQSWLKSWTDDEEDGWFEDEYDDSEDPDERIEVDASYGSSL